MQGHRRAQLVHRESEPVGTGLGVLLEQAFLGESAQQSMCRALADAEPAGELGDADVAVAPSELLE